MIFKSEKVAEAYEALGLEQGSSLEEVKSTYKQLALKTHPDKNPDPNATAQFQRVSSAYNTLVKHLDRSEPSPLRGTGSFSFGFGQSYDSEYEGYDEYDSDDSADNTHFYFYIFEEVMRERASRFSRARFNQARRHPSPQETPENYEARLRRAREEQAAAAERRAKEAEARKARQERERENERQAAEDRQRVKAETKRAQAEAIRKKAVDAARALAERRQTIRSTAFAAARSGDAQRVRKAIWEDGVDASGGELNAGGEKFIKCEPKDPKETLLHIAAKQGDVELVKWLDDHSADLEEVNSQGLTPFHVAMQNGHLPIVKHFLEACPPKDPEYKAIYTLPPPNTLLSLAIDSAVPEIVWIVLDKQLATTRDVTTAWARVSSQANNKSGVKAETEKAEEIRSILKVFGGFTPPSTPKVVATTDSHLEQSPYQEPSLTTEPPAAEPTTVPGRQVPPRQYQKKSQRSSMPRVEQIASQSESNNVPTSSRASNAPNSRGRGRARGRAHGRGRA